MTPAPISVERLCVHTADHGDDRKPYGMMMPDARGEYVRHSDYAALLHQLAELEADVDFVRGCLRSRGEYIEGQPPLPLAVVAYDHMWKRAEAAERAREEAVSVLRFIDDTVPYSALGDTAAERLAAFLAASGGA